MLLCFDFRPCQKTLLRKFFFSFPPTEQKHVDDWCANLCKRCRWNPLITTSSTVSGLLAAAISSLLVVCVRGDAVPAAKDARDVRVFSFRAPSTAHHANSRQKGNVTGGNHRVVCTEGLRGVYISMRRDELQLSLGWAPSLGDSVSALSASCINPQVSPRFLLLFMFIIILMQWSKLQRKEPELTFGGNTILLVHHIIAAVNCKEVFVRITSRDIYCQRTFTVLGRAASDLQGWSELEGNCSHRY